MTDYKCKGCLIDSTHGKLQKKKEALLEFIFAPNSLCLTVSAQNVNIMAYTLSKDTISAAMLYNDLFVITFKEKKQIKLSALPANKLYELKCILESLLNEDLSAYENNVKKFRQISGNSSNTSRNSIVKTNHVNSDVPSETIQKKTSKIDKMKHANEFFENDENSQPNSSKSNEKKKNTLPSASNFYPHSQHNSIDENTEYSSQSQQQCRKRTSTNQSTNSTIRFEHATNSSSPYFFQRTDNRIKRHLSNGESRISPLKNIHSKPLNNTRLWDDDDDNYLYDWRDSPYTTKRGENSTSPDISLSKAVTTTMSLRKKGLKNIGATCYMNSILQCLLNIDPFRYDIMVTNSELITSSLLEENTIYLCVLRILSLLQDRQLTQSQNSTTTQLTDDERIVESQALINLKKAVEKHSGVFLGSRQQDSHEFLNLVISLITDEIDAIKTQIKEQSLVYTHKIVDPTTNNFQFCLATERCCEMYVRKSKKGRKKSLYIILLCLKAILFPI
ncbi:hypothetical protein I4U23_029256 [Adineta vaga]|nr:hypothetical protein I4U23_029256 [Adineta vaga]